MGTAAPAEHDAEASRPGARPESAARGGTWLSVGVAMVAAAALALPRLGSRTMWLDEVYTVGATSELLDTWRRTGGTQALYYLLVWPVAQVSTDPWAMRLPSALFALAALGVVYEAGRRIWDARVGVLATGGLALSWGLARYSMEARSYTLALLLVSLSWLALVALVQGGDPDERGRWWWVFVAVTLLAPLAHGLSVLQLAAQLAALTVAPEGRRWLRRTVPVLAALGLEMVALFALGASDIGDWVPPLELGQVLGIGQLLLGFGVTGVVLAGLTAWAAADVSSRFWRERTATTWCRVIPVFWALLPPLMLVALSLVRPYASARYVFSALPGVLLLVAGLLARIRSWRLLAAASLVVAVLLLKDQGRATEVGIEDWRGLTACLAANATDGDQVLAITPHRPPLDYYWPRVTDATTPTVASLTSDRLGEVKRIYDPDDDPTDRLLAHTGPDSVWYVDRGTWGRVTVAGLAFSEEIAARYDMTDPWHFEGDLTLVRLDPVGGAGAARPRAPCDTVPPPVD
jgi:mannosyltransferase